MNHYGAGQRQAPLSAWARASARPRGQDRAGAECYALSWGAADLYARFPGRVGIAAFGDQTFYGIRAHHRRAAHRLLLEEHILFDYVTEDRFTAAELAQYRVVIFPDITAAGPEQLAALRAYVAGGGHAVLIGKRPTRDLQLRPLDAARLPEALRVGEDALAERGGVRAWDWTRAPDDGPGSTVYRLRAGDA